MGQSFIGVGKNQLGFRHLGLICAIVVKEFDDLPKESSLRSVVKPFRNLIMEDAVYTGYSTSINLTKLFHEQKHLEELASFFDLVSSKLQSFGTALPREYSAALQYGEYFQKETWLVSKIIQDFTELAKILREKPVPEGVEFKSSKPVT